jgi:cell division protein FtsB
VPRREQGSRKPRSALGRFADAVRAGSEEARAAAPRSAASRGRPTQRPGARRTAASRGADRRFNRRSGGRFTGRAAIVAVVVSVLVLTLAYPLQEYLAQRSQLAAAEQEQAEQLARIADLEEQKRKWNDPTYVRAQASRRLQLVEPGVTVYKIKSDAEPAAEQPGPGAVVGKASSKSPWYSQLWSSVKAADRPAGATPARTPAK